MNSFQTNYPTVVRLFRWFFHMPLFTWKFLRRLLLTCVVLVTLIVAYFTEEKFRSQWEWKKLQHSLEAQGQPIHLSQVIPPLIPDDQNFAMTPLLKPIFNADAKTPQEQSNGEYARDLRRQLNDWPVIEGKSSSDRPRFNNVGWPTGKSVNLKDWQDYIGSTDMLQPFKSIDPMLDEITAASRRSNSRFPIHYEFGYATTVPHLSPITSLAGIFQLRALAELAQGQPDHAVGDVITILQLSNALSNDLGLISLTFASGIADRGIQVIWEGLAAHHWSDSQLMDIQNGLRKIDLIAAGRRDIYAENLMNAESLGPTLDKVGNVEALLGPNISRDAKRIFTLSGSNIFGFPKGWLYQNLLVNGHFVRGVISAYDLEHHHLDACKIGASDSAITQSSTTPYNVLAKLIAPSLSWISTKIAYAQTSIDEANIACAIERYRFANGKLPESLDVLIPKFIAKLPNDIISGKPLIYRRTRDDNYVLYSVGWDGKDDGGKIASNNDGGADISQGDWVWTYPARDKAP